MCSLEIENSTLLLSQKLHSAAASSSNDGGVAGCNYRSTVSGGIIDEAIPDPIPNSEVKLIGADGTAWGIYVGE